MVLRPTSNQNRVRCRTALCIGYKRAVLSECTRCVLSDCSTEREYVCSTEREYVCTRLTRIIDDGYMLILEDSTLTPTEVLLSPILSYAFAMLSPVLPYAFVTLSPYALSSVVQRHI